MEIRMKTIKLDVLKKNRIYFKCKTENGYEVKLKVTQKSENIELGLQELLVRDVSVRTKYGTDIIYDLESEVKTKSITTLQHRYNRELVEKCKSLGGKWDSKIKTWVFTSVVENEVEELDAQYNSEMINVEITALVDLNSWQGPVHFLGYPLAKAVGRDSGARLCDEIAMISGKISSSGSMKNWYTSVDAGTVFRLNLSKNLLKEVNSEKWEVKVLDE